LWPVWRGGGHEMDWSGLGCGQVARCWECGNEHSGYVKWGELLDYLREGQITWILITHEPSVLLTSSPVLHVFHLGVFL
jgi:hypothetical protein